MRYGALYEVPGIVIRFLRLWRLGANDLRLLWFALRHPRRPVWLWPVAIVLAFYALEPINFAVPLVGVLDDFVILPLILRVLVHFLPLEIRAGYGLRMPRGRGRAAVPAGDPSP